MRLIDCYIENFGGLSSFSLKFEDGLTVVMEQNGFGKTTLAAFIKAMFFGFQKNVRSLEKNERKLYTPWQGGKFGGNLSFEHEGIKYRIERSFGATPKQDTFTLYELDPFQKSEVFSENIGEELFKLDMESYEKSTFMSQNDDSLSFATAGIQTKLGDLVEETDDIYNFDKAIELLKDKRSKYKAYRGNSGSIHELNGKITDLEYKLAKESSVTDMGVELERQYNDILLKVKKNENELEIIRKRITDASEIKVIENLNKQYEKLKRDRADINEKLEQLLKNYEKGLPTKESVDSLQDMLMEFTAINQAKNSLKESPEDVQFVEENKEFFGNGVPSQAKLDKLQEANNSYNSLKQELYNLREKRLQQQAQKPEKKPVVLLILGLLFLLSGIGLCVAGVVNVGVILAVIGIVLTIVHFCIKRLEPVLVDDTLEEENRLTATLREKTKEIEDFLATYYDKGEIEEANYNTLILQLANRTTRYISAQQAVSEYKNKSAEYNNGISELDSKISLYAAEQGFTCVPTTIQDLRKVSEDIVKGEELLSLLEKNEKETDVFLAENESKLKERNIENGEDLNALKMAERSLLNENGRLTEALLNAKQRIADNTSILDSFPILEDQLTRLKEEVEAEKQACQLLEDTIGFLTSAKENITNTQINPVKERFDTYVSQLLNHKDFKSFMGKELDVKPEGYGEAKDLAYFSAGYTDIVKVCMHFALVDVLFEDTDCFIILDDPFVNLDDEKTKAAVALLKELSKRRQIVYLVCNSSRI